MSAIFKMAVTGRNFSMSGIISGHHNLPTFEMSLTSNNVEFVRYCGANLKMVTARNFPMSGINSGHHYLPTYQIVMISDNVEFLPPGHHFQNGGHNTAQIQHCSISKVAFNLFFKPVVSGRFGRLHNP
jgi:hypothetical protein